MSNSYSYGKRAWNIRLGSGHSFLGAYLVHLSSFEDGHKVLVLLVGALLHLHVVSCALFDLSAEEGQLCQVLGDVIRGLHFFRLAILVLSTATAAAKLFSALAYSPC